MLHNKAISLMPRSDSVTMNVIVANLMVPDSNAVPTYSVCSYTMSGENPGLSAPLDESAVRIGNSLLSADVPEEAIRRDGDEGF
jgi:hypothetical protein